MEKSTITIGARELFPILSIICIAPFTREFELASGHIDPDSTHPERKI